VRGAATAALAMIVSARESCSVVRDRVGAHFLKTITSI
jgi:hypothetical protein